jgi:hypothetical protein
LPQSKKQSSEQAEREEDVPYIDVTWLNGRSGLRWKAKLALAWNSKYRRFKEIEVLQMEADFKLRCELRVAGPFSEFPEFLRYEMDGPDRVVKIADGLLDLELRHILEPDCFAGDRRISRWVKDLWINIDSQNFGIKALATLQPPRGMHVPDVYIRSHFFCGGLPSLGKGSR